ncbi:hypothetical protein [Gracilibacillus alcaliphilus]|uniref:hypothetical protein n=1 Tax=Gracilibacillus alcaliphilus TaxID=1401441 RepID=UPI00195D331C|nr:hypothetical protein [Gracilibacillus alcaliphilus]MBM7678520.1 hypothetical protein [Gracilibacillus alcaliphilus]
MLRSVNDLLNMAEFQSFVGRDEELQLMRGQLEVEERQWNTLHFHGFNGIGKNALLKRFMKISSVANMIYLDTEKGIRSPQHFLDNIAKKLYEHNNRTNKISIDITKPYTTFNITDCLNIIADKNPPFILLFDSLELWNPIMEWLFESFIPKLSVKVRLISAGRDSLEGKWLRSNSWDLLVKNVQLKPLNKEHVHEYLKTVGVVEPALRHTIVKLSNGIPFAMNLCYKLINESGQQIETADFKQIIRILCQTILDELDISTKQRSLLDAVSVVGQFDKELLMHITGQTISYADFDQFCNIQIITKAKEGWSILDGIRNWIQTDFKEHSPELFSRYKKRALEVLHRRWNAADPLKRRSLFLENVYAVENKLLQEYYFLGDETVYDIRTALQEDIASIMEIWKNRHLNTLQSVNDGTEQEKLIQSVWELEPAAIKAFWEKDRIVGFTAIVSLTNEARKVFLKNDLYRNYLLNTKTEENERLFWIGAAAKKDDYEALNAVYRYFFEHLMDNCLCTVMFPTDYDVSGLMSLGFKELPWGSSVSPSGKKFRMLQVDFREISLLQLLTTSYPVKTKKSIPISEGIQWMKKLLLSFYDFESDSELFEETMAIIGIKNDATSGKTIRLSIKDAIKEIGSRTEKDRMMMRSIELTYIDRIGSNEIAAERLHLSTSTYYRYVRKGIEKLALQFIK